MWKKDNILKYLFRKSCFIFNRYYSDVCWKPSLDPHVPLGRLRLKFFNSWRERLWGWGVLFMCSSHSQSPPLLYPQCELASTSELPSPSQQAPMFLHSSVPEPLLGFLLGNLWLLSPSCTLLLWFLIFLPVPIRTVVVSGKTFLTTLGRVSVSWIPDNFTHASSKIMLQVELNSCKKIFCSSHCPWLRMWSFWQKKVYCRLI